MFQMKQKVSSQRQERMHLKRASVTVVELRAKPPKRVLVLPTACLLAIKQHGVWEHHAL